MRLTLLTTVSLAMLSVFIGCQQEAMMVSVRFAMPPALEEMPDASTDSEARLVAHSAEGGFAHEAVPSQANAIHVALWGGQFNGEDVTHLNTALAPGHYTFALLLQDSATAAQGWIHVNPIEGGLVDLFRKWKQNIPTQKQMLAYDYDLQGKIQRDPAEFESLTRQLCAFEQLERKLDYAIARERGMYDAARERYTEFLKDAVVLVLPGDQGFINPMTRPAFSEDDLGYVRSGDTVTKVLIVSDYEDIQWKLRLVSRMARDVRACKIALSEEAARLQRCKQLYAMTRHIYKHDRELVRQHDRKFVENEMRLQASFAAMERFDEQLTDLRERRVALAFACELTAPNGMYDPLDDEHRTLTQERVVLETEKHRVDLLFAQVPEDSPNRSALERRRQRYIRAIEGIDRQCEALTEARLALKKMKDSSEVIHRQGESRLLAASFVDQDIPAYVRAAIERESVMTLRLQPSENLFAPSNAKVASAATH